MGTTKNTALGNICHQRLGTKHHRGQLDTIGDKLTPGLKHTCVHTRAISDMHRTHTQARTNNNSNTNKYQLNKKSGKNLKIRSIIQILKKFYLSIKYLVFYDKLYNDLRYFKII